MHNEKTSKRKVPQLTLLKLKGISPEFIMQSKLQIDVKALKLFFTDVEML